MKDDNCKTCYKCSITFTVFNRRHHCRICGQIFCNNCSNQSVDSKKGKYVFGSLRYKIVTTDKRNRQKLEKAIDNRITDSEDRLNPKEKLRIK